MTLVRLDHQVPGGGVRSPGSRGVDRPELPLVSIVFSLYTPPYYLWSAPPYTSLASMAPPPLYPLSIYVASLYPGAALYAPLVPMAS